MNATAATIKEFCARNRISASTYFALKREGLGPREMLVGRAGVRISPEAEADWRRAMEARAATASPKEAA